MFIHILYSIVAQYCNYIVCLNCIGLVGGNSPYEGRVEVNFNGQWGTICDDFWSPRDANVVCKQLGYGTAAAWPRVAAFGSGDGIIWLDNLRCIGNETDLFACPHNGPGNHNCGHNEDAGVVCTDIRKCTIAFIIDLILASLYNQLWFEVFSQLKCYSK